MSQVTVLNQLDGEAQKIVARYDQKNAALLTLLHLAQDKIGYVSPDAEAWAAKWSEIPVVHVREVVTFYSMYHQKPVGKHHIRFCTGTSCVLRGAEEALCHLKKKLGIDPSTMLGAGNGWVSPDGKISLEEAECLCNCEAAPMMQVDGPYHTDLTDKKIDEILGGLK